LERDGKYSLEKSVARSRQFDAHRLGNRIFVTQAVPKEHRRSLLCFDRTDGRLLWEQGPVQAEDEPTHATNPQCAASPVTDGQHVYAWFGSAGLYCYALDGTERWHKALGAQNHIWGNAASPVLYEDLCLLNFGPGEPSFLLALDKKTGKERWRVAEPNADSGAAKPGKDKTSVGWFLEHTGDSASRPEGRTASELANSSGGFPTANWPRTLDVRRPQPAGLHFTALRSGHTNDCGDGRFFGHGAGGQSRG
jgi:hypothetical protein